MVEAADKALVTIIIGIYNGEKYLCDCLDSVINQDYENLEIILVNDGSNDLSGKIADGYAQRDKRVKVFHQENMGVSISRNCAIRCSHGEYICIVDQDDCLSEDYVSYFYNLIIHFNAEIACTPSADKFFAYTHAERVKKDKAYLWTGSKAAEEMLYHKIVIAPWNKMIARSLIEKYQIYFQPQFFCGEGFAFSIQCFLKANRVAMGNRKIYHYRVGNPESGASKFRLSTIYSSVNAQQYIKDIIAKGTPALQKAWKFSNWHTHCDCLNIMVGCGVVNQHREEYESLRRICRKDALCSLNAPVPLQQKVRGVLFFLNPYFAACVINLFRLRKFARGDNDSLIFCDFGVATFRDGLEVA